MRSPAASDKRVCMENLRRDFHDVVNKLNKITIKAGLLVELAKTRKVDSMSHDEIRAQYKRALGILSGAESDALEAGKVIEKIKKEVYSLFDPGKKAK